VICQPCISQNKLRGIEGLGHLDIYSKIYKGPVPVGDLMPKLSALGQPFTAAQVTVLAGVPNEYAPQLVNELRHRQLVRMQTGKRHNTLRHRLVVVEKPKNT